MLKRFQGLVNKIIPNSEFIRNVGVVSGGTVLGRMLVVIVSPLLTRLYTPEEFGVLAVFMALWAIFTPISAWRLEAAIPISDTRHLASNTVALSLLAVLTSVLLLSGAVLLGGTLLTDMLEVPELGAYMWLLPVGVFFSGLYNVSSQWALRTRRFLTLAIASILGALVLLAIQIFGFEFGPIALVAGVAFGQSIGGMVLFAHILADGAEYDVRFSRIGEAAKRFYRFPLFGIGATLLNSSSRQIVTLLFASFFGPASAGLFSLANRVLYAPISLLGIAVGQVFFPTAAAAHRQGRLTTIVNLTHIQMAQLAMTPAIVLMLVGPELFELVFGEQWRTAGEFARWMGPWLYLAFLTAPFTHLFAVLELQKENLYYNVIVFVSRMLAIAVGIYFEDMLLTVQLFAVASAGACLWLFYFLLVPYYQPKFQMLMPSARAMLWSVPIISPFIIYPFIENTLLHMAIATAITGALFAWRVYHLLHTQWTEVKDL